MTLPAASLAHRRGVPRQPGFTVVEILVALVITIAGLLGIAALQTQLHVSELESLQRAQALTLLTDITDRLNANRATASCFAITTDDTTGTPYLGTLGAGHLSTPTCAVSNSANNAQAVATLNAVDALLRGAAATSAADAEIGAMIGARACISYDPATVVSGQAGTGLYTITVSWQGMSDTFAPAVSCANGLYGAETKRRAVSTTVRLATL
ncbi:type IV pilus modification protein PilV [Endothiovibrio diazotrophicus]